MNLVPYSIQGWGKESPGGLTQNKKSFALKDTEFPQLLNAYCFRERILKREGLKLAGRYKRAFFNDSIGISGASPWTFNIYAAHIPAIVPETDAQIDPGSVVIYIGASIVTGAITGYTIASDCEVTSAGHGLATGDMVEINGVIVVEGSGPDDINGKTYTIEVITANTFKLGVSSQSWGTYSSGGTWSHAVAANQKLIDQGNGTLATAPPSTTTGIINYLTGNVTITNGSVGVATDIDFGYFPGLPSMGILLRERVGINDEQTIFFDTKYAYIHDGNEFQEFIPGTTWTGSDSDFFWGTNFRGSEPQNRLFFVTNFVINVEGAGSKDPIRFTDGATWTDFTPIVGSTVQDDNFPPYLGVVAGYAGNLTQFPIIPGTVAITVETEPPIVFRDTAKDGSLIASGLNTGMIDYVTGAFTLNFNPPPAAGSYDVDAQYNFGTSFLQQARILIPYYGRLLALNVWEGSAVNTSSNIFNRCRFSQVGNPLQKDAWRSDTFGKGGFIDAPINEEIISAIFYKNTLIVFFEESTWQLRYVGDYGLPFIWERISSDFGSESTFSTILFDRGVLAVGDKAIVSSTGNSIERIDLDIPDKVFNFSNLQQGVKRVHGIRDYQKELVYWTYSDGQYNRKFPNYSLLYNYRNQSFAIFRNNVTTYGYLKSPGAITWDNNSVTWDDPVSWDEEVIENFPLIVSGNQQGFVHFYGYPDVENVADSLVNALDQESLAIKAIDLTVSPIVVTVPNHNLETEEIIYIVGMQFLNSTQTLPLATTLNNSFYQVSRLTNDTFSIDKYNFNTNLYESNFTFTPVTDAVYIGGGMLALMPVMDIRTKDLNPYDKKGISTKLSYVDFLLDAQNNAALTVKLYVNARTPPNSEANIIVTSQNVSESLTSNGNIINVTQANPGVVTTQKPHGLANGDDIRIESVVGMIELNSIVDPEITVISENKFSIGIDTTGFTPYISGGSYVQTNNPFYIPSSNYAWQRYYGGCNGQFIAVNLTYNDELMNQLATHQQLMVLNAIKLWIKEGTKSIF